MSIDKKISFPVLQLQNLFLITKKKQFLNLIQVANTKKINSYVSKIRQVTVKYQGSVHFTCNSQFNVLFYHFTIIK